MEGVDNRPF